MQTANLSKPNANQSSPNLLLKKKQFLREMLETLGLAHSELKDQISNCSSIQQCDSLAKTYSLPYFKMNLKNRFEEFGMLSIKLMRIINNATSIEMLERQTKEKRKQLNVFVQADDELKRSLIGSEFISTTKSIRAILTGMLY